MRLRWIDRLITLHGVDEGQRAKLAEIAEKTPVTMAVRAGTEIPPRGGPTGGDACDGATQAVGCTDPMTERIVVIGADAAGMSAASQAKRIAGEAVEIVAFERGAYSSYSACGIPYWVAGDVDGPESLVARSPDAHRRNGIDLRMRTEVEKIDLAAGRVLVHDLAAGRFSCAAGSP